MFKSNLIYTGLLISFMTASHPFCLLAQTSPQVVRYSCGVTVVPGGDVQNLRNIFFSLKVNNAAEENLTDSYTFTLGGYGFQVSLFLENQKENYGSVKIKTSHDGVEFNSTHIYGPVLDSQFLFDGDVIGTKCEYDPIVND